MSVFGVGYKIFVLFQVPLADGVRIVLVVLGHQLARTIGLFLPVVVVTFVFVHFRITFVWFVTRFLTLVLQDVFQRLFLSQLLFLLLVEES